VFSPLLPVVLWVRDRGAGVSGLSGWEWGRFGSGPRLEKIGRWLGWETIGAGGGRRAGLEGWRAGRSVSRHMFHSDVRCG
jgi:hypothetical protein